MLGRARVTTVEPADHMTILAQSQMPSPERVHPLVALRSGAWKYGPGFAIQVASFYLILVLGQIAATGLGVGRLQLAIGFALVVIAMGTAEAHFRLYKRVWSVAGLSDAVSLALAVIEASALVVLMDALIPGRWRPFNIVVPVLVAPIVLSAVAGFRLLPRILSRHTIGENRLLIVVGDSRQYETVKSLAQSSNALWSAVGIVTHNAIDDRRTVMGVPVVGSTKNLAHWIEVTNADGVAFILGNIGQPDFGTLVGTCLNLEKPIFVIPSAQEWFQPTGASAIRQLTADDLIANTNADLRLEAAAERIAGRTVLVTGASGSVGSELCKALVTLKPKRIVLVDNNESGLFETAAILRATAAVDVEEALVSITDRELLLTVFTEERPEVVFHAAAYKHVPMLESHPEQAVTVNVVGTRNVLWCAEAVSTREFILISTDKAASSASVMGCTKRICELMVLSHEGTMECRAVRFGNVVGSRGSVIPIFERQIQRGGPVTITDPEMTRYMMTLRQAAALVIYTIVLPRAHLYMLEMGKPVKILDIANALIRSRGLRPGKDIQVVFTGPRKGERLSEDLLGPDESWRPTQHPSIREVVTPVSPHADDLQWTIERLTELASDQKSTELVRALKQAVWPRVTSADEMDRDAGRAASNEVVSPNDIGDKDASQR